MNTNNKKWISAITVVTTTALMMTGCAQKTGVAEKVECSTIEECSLLLSERKGELSQSKIELEKQNKKIAELQTLLSQTKSQKEMIPAPAVSAESSLYPPNAKPGECYARVLIPAEYQNEQVRLLKKEESERIEVIPAKYRWVEKKVLVKEASEKIITIPPVYGTATKKVLVKEESQRVTQVPPVYETITEKVLVKAGYTTWKRGRGPIEKLDTATGEIMCLIEIPPVYKTVTKKVLKTPAATVSTPIPAVYKTVTKKVLKTPAATKTVEIPAEYRTVRVKELVEPASIKKLPVPALYQSITKRMKVKDAELKWRPILCETNFNRNLIAELQRSLLKSGFNPGPIDGIYGWRTKAATNKFQKSKGLPSGALTISTLQALHVGNY